MKKTELRYIVIKFLNIVNKNKLLKAAIGKNIIFKGRKWK